MIRIIWSSEARSNLIRQIRYIQVENPRAARQVADDIRTACTRLMDHPWMGRPGISEGTRELVVGNYVIVYQVLQLRIEILFVHHGAQDWK